jgi:hypothetical protein
MGLPVSGRAFRRRQHSNNLLDEGSDISAELGRVVSQPFSSQCEGRDRGIVREARPGSAPPGMLRLIVVA